MTTPDSAIGDVIVLRRGAALAEITTVGAHLRRFAVAGREAIIPFGDEPPWGAHGAVLAPWPNRLRDGRYEWEGRTHALPITDPAHHAAIHGLVMDLPWTTAAGTDRARLTTTLTPRPGYPFHLAMSLTYSLGPAELDVDFTARNLGPTAAPFGVGFHPWLAAGPGGIDAADLQFHAESWFRPDDRLLPVAEEPVPAEFDFSVRRAIGGTRIDDAFTAVHTGPRGRSWVHLHGDDGVRVSAWMVPPLSVWQLCTDPGPSPRPAIAVEPMTCAADAFTTGDRLHRLEPGQELVASWGLVVD